MRIHFLQHADHEGPANLARWAERRGHAISVTRAYAGERLPEVDDFDWLVVLGGAMNVNEEKAHPWLVTEKRLLSEAVRTAKQVLGICLGAQLLAESLGAKVGKNPVAEIGWFPVRLTAEGKHHPLFAGAPEALPVFHWHEETFALPTGAVRLAESAACANQAFIVGNHLLGLQFHPEVAAADVGNWLADGASLLPAGPFVQTPDAMRSASHFALMEDWLNRLLDRLAL